MKKLTKIGLIGIILRDRGSCIRSLTRKKKP